MLGDAISGHVVFGMIPEHKLDNSSKLKRSLNKLLEYDFSVLLLATGTQFRVAATKVAEFLKALAETEK